MERENEFQNDFHESRQDENALTEIFCKFLERCPKLRTYLLSKMCHMARHRLKDCKIEPQKRYFLSRERWIRPDISVNFPGGMIFIEIKLDANEHGDQISDYKRYLREECGPDYMTGVLLISRWETSTRKRPTWRFKWDDIYGLLQDESSPYAKDFRDFLEMNYLIFEPVGPEAFEGLKDSKNFFGIIEEIFDKFLDDEKPLLTDWAYRYEEDKKKAVFGDTYYLLTSLSEKKASKGNYDIRFNLDYMRDTFRKENVGPRSYFNLDIDRNSKWEARKDFQFDDRQSFITRGGQLRKGQCYYPLVLNETFYENSDGQTDFIRSYFIKVITLYNEMREWKR